MSLTAMVGLVIKKMGENMRTLLREQLPGCRFVVL
jgi:hypothetical protein